jgi:hypothetical protein
MDGKPPPRGGFPVQASGDRGALPAVVDLSNGRTKIWLKPEIARWASEQAARGRIRPARRVAR